MPLCRTKRVQKLVSSPSTRILHAECSACNFHNSTEQIALYPGYADPSHDYAARCTGTIESQCRAASYSKRGVALDPTAPEKRRDQHRGNYPAHLNGIARIDGLIRNSPQEYAGWEADHVLKRQQLRQCLKTSREQCDRRDLPREDHRHE